MHPFFPFFFSFFLKFEVATSGFLFREGFSSGLSHSLDLRERGDFEAEESSPRVL